MRPGSVPGSPAAVASELGLRNVAFEVTDLQAAVDWAATEGYGLVGGIGEYEGAWRMAYVRGQESSSHWPSASAEPRNARICRRPDGSSGQAPFSRRPRNITLTAVACQVVDQASPCPESCCWCRRISARSTTRRRR